MDKLIWFMLAFLVSMLVFFIVESYKNRSLAKRILALHEIINIYEQKHINEDYCDGANTVIKTEELKLVDFNKRSYHNAPYKTPIHSYGKNCPLIIDSVNLI